MDSRLVAAGAVGGAAAVVAFAVVHQLVISNIWWMIVPMLVVGALCGMGLAWNYGALVDEPSVRGWVAFNALHVGLLAVLTLISFALFDPVMSMAEVVNSTGGLPDELASRALPVTLAYAGVSAVVVQILFRGRWSTFPVTLVATVALQLLLGLNLAAAGLVDIPRESLYLIAEFLGLVILIAGVYAGVSAVAMPPWSRSGLSRVD